MSWRGSARTHKFLVKKLWKFLCEAGNLDLIQNNTNIDEMIYCNDCSENPLEKYAMEG